MDAGLLSRTRSEFLWPSFCKLPISGNQDVCTPLTKGRVFTRPCTAKRVLYGCTFWLALHPQLQGTTKAADGKSLFFHRQSEDGW